MSLLYKKLKPAVDEVKGNLFLVEQKRPEILRILQRMMKILNKGFDKEGYGHHYDRYEDGALTIAFRELTGLKTLIDVYNRDNSGNNGYQSLCHINFDEESKEFERTKEKANLKHYEAHLALYW